MLVWASLAFFKWNSTGLSLVLPVSFCQSQLPCVIWVHSILPFISSNISRAYGDRQNNIIKNCYLKKTKLFKNKFHVSLPLPYNWVLCFWNSFKLGHEQTFSVWLKKPEHLWLSVISTVLVQVHCWCSERWLQEFFSNSQVLLWSLFIFVIKSDAIIDFAVYNSLWATGIAV